MRQAVSRHSAQQRPRHGAHCAHDTAMKAYDTHGTARRGVGAGARRAAGSARQGAHDSGRWAACSRRAGCTTGARARRGRTQVGMSHARGERDKGAMRAARRGLGVLLANGLCTRCT